jgi:hypothetical protein
MRELSRRAFPEPDAVADDAPAPIEQASEQRRRQTARQERAAREAGTPTIGPPAAVRTTA